MTSQGWAGRQLCSSVPPWPGEVFIVEILHGEFVFGLHELFGKEVHVEVCMVHLSLTGAVAVADAHGAGGRGPGVGDGAGRGQHGHVEADVDVLDAGLVDAADAVGLRLEGHHLEMLLDHKDEVGLTLKEYFLIIIFPKNTLIKKMKNC